MSRALQVLLFAGLLGVSAQLLFYRQPVGLNLVVGITLFLALAWTTRRAPVRLADAWIPAFAVAFAAFAALRTDAAVVAFDVVAAVGLSLAATTALRGTAVSTLPLVALIREGWSVAAAVLGAAALPLRAEAPRIRATAGSRTRSATAYAAGAAAAVPFLIAFGFLFMSADAVFAHWAEETLDAEDWLDRLGMLWDRTAIAVAASWLAAGALARIAFTPTDPDRGSCSWPRLPIETATVVLISIDLLFVAFVSFQITYLFGGRDTIEAAAIPYAEYARRGFFELVAVALMVAALLFALELAVGRRTRAYVAAGIGLVALTGVTLASSMYRLDLYQRAYGWSELRVYVGAGIAFLACALLILAWALAKRRMHLAAQPIAFAALSVALLVNASGPSALIARANIDRAMELAAVVEPESADAAETAERELDRWYLVTLGDGAVPDVVAGLDRLPETDASCLRMLLLWQAMGRDLDSAPSWQGWSADRERARQALLSIRDDLYALIAYPRDDYAAKPSQRLETRYQSECTGYGRARARALIGS